MHHAILGLAKLKRGDVAGRASHHLRGHAVANADPQRAHLNASTWKGDARALADAIEQRVGPLRKRKDAVSAIELMLTASPEWFPEHGGKGDLRELVKRAQRWAADTFGASNIAAVGVHRDESTPHVWLLVTPITPDGRLSAAHFCDGPKKLAAMHDSWSAATADLGLSRGVRASRAKHVEVRTFYAAAQGSPAAAMKLTREMTARQTRAQKRAEAAEREAAEAESRAAKHRQVQQQLEAERERLARLAEAMSPAEQERAARRLADLEEAARKASPRPGPASGPPEARKRPLRPS